MKRGKKNKNIIIALGMIAVLTIVFVSNVAESENKVCFKKNCFSVEIADTKEERETGLMFRELEEGTGMLFIFEEEGLYNFWMKNTIIPLDIIWINSNNQIVYIEHSAQPCKEDPCAIINPGNYAKYVVEVNGGEAKEIGLNRGDEAKIKISS